MTKLSKAKRMDPWKNEGKSDDPKGKGKAWSKGEKGNETRDCHECNKPGHPRKDCTVYKKRMADKTDTTTAA